MTHDRFDPKPISGHRREPMERVRLGVTGLAAVLLFVALATAIASSVRRTATLGAVPPVVPTLPEPNNAAAMPRAEPLEQLGVAPPTGEKGAPAPAKPAR